MISASVQSFPLDAQGPAGAHFLDLLGEFRSVFDGQHHTAGRGVQGHLDKLKADDVADAPFRRADGFEDHDCAVPLRYAAPDSAAGHRRD